LHPSSIAKRSPILLFIVFILFYFYALGHFPLLGPDEPRYAQIAREMYLRGDWITPTLGGHLWFEKPSLLYWLMIASYKLFGISEWSARLGPAICGLSTIAAVYWLGRRIESAVNAELNGLAFWSTLVAGNTLGIIAFSRAASFDIVITATVAWTLAFFLAAEIEAQPRKQQLFLAAFYVFVGLSLLAKGLVGIVIPFGVIGTYYLLARTKPRAFIWQSLLWGAPLALAIAATWYAPMIARHGRYFLDQFFVQHHFARYITSKYHHPQPVYFYILIILGLSLPWPIVLFDGLLKSIKRVWPRPAAPSPEYQFRIFMLAWILLPLVFFSLSRSKLPGYILPVFPALAFIAGNRLTQLQSAIAAKWPLKLTAGLCLFVAVGSVVYLAGRQLVTTSCALLIMLPLLVPSAVGLFVARKVTLFAITLSAAVLITLAIALNCAAPRFVEGETSKRLLQIADARGYAGATVFGLQRDDRSLEFYAAGRVAYDGSGEAVMYEDSTQIVFESTKRNATILAMVPLAEVNQFQNFKQVRTEVIGDNGRRALVAVTPVQR